MQSCFVIQPFNSVFDKRYDDTFAEAIKNANLVPYRVDRDPSTSILIESIESGIKKSAICFADITEDNPNVWYELGFAFAAGKEVVMACAENRVGKKYPFDIQHRHVIQYKTESSSDFKKLQEEITSRINSALERQKHIDIISASDTLAPIEGLSQSEFLVLTIIAGNAHLETAYPAYKAKNDAERAGLTSLGFNIGLRKLITKDFASLVEIYDEQAHDTYDGIKISGLAWEWIERNESKFVIHHQQTQSNEIDDIVF